MKKEDRYSIKNLKKDFPTDEACLNYLFDKLHSRDCSCGGKYAKLSGRLQFQCSKCRFQIAPMSGTIFEKSTTPLTSWFHAVFIFSNAKSGISAKEMERQLGVTYKTAWRILHLIRTSLKQNTRKLRGGVETDQAWFGGVKKAGENNKYLSESMKAKSVVMGAVERGGEVRAKIAPDATASTIGEFLKDNVETENTTLYSDASNRYELVAKGYERLTVYHNLHQYAIGNIHINHMESFWSHVKRSIKGSYKVISKQHLQAYLDAFAFHYNNRYNDKDRFDALLGRVVRTV